MVCVPVGICSKNSNNEVKTLAHISEVMLAAVGPLLGEEKFVVSEILIKSIGTPRTYAAT